MHIFLRTETPQRNIIHHQTAVRSGMRKFCNRINTQNYTLLSFGMFFKKLFQYDCIKQHNFNRFLLAYSLCNFVKCSFSCYILVLWSCDYWTALEVWSVCQKNQWILGLYNSWGNIQLLFKISCPHLKSWNSCIIRGLQRRLYLWLILAEAGEVVYVIIHMVCVIPCGLKMLCGTCVSWTVLGRMLLKKKSQGSLMLDFFPSE